MKNIGVCNGKTVKRGKLLLGYVAALHSPANVTRKKWLSQIPLLSCLKHFWIFTKYGHKIDILSAHWLRTSSQWQQSKRVGFRLSAPKTKSMVQQSVPKPCSRRETEVSLEAKFSFQVSSPQDLVLRGPPPLPEEVLEELALKLLRYIAWINAAMILVSLM